MNINQIISNLKQPIPPKFISQKQIKGNTIDFISWFDYCDLLDERVGIWEWSIVSMTTTDDRLFITGKLVIHGDDRSLSQMATGTEILNCSSYGDPSSNAEAMALRRACAKFGLARDLWRKEEKQNNSFNNHHQTNKPKSYRPKAKGEISREQWLQLKRHQK